METQGSVAAPCEEEDGELDVPDDAALAAMVPARFGIRDEKTADWLVRKVVEANAHVARVKEQADREIRRTERERDFLLYRFGKDLETWTKIQLAASNGQRKSLLMLSGTVGFRSVGEKLVVEDDATVVRWAKKYCRGAVVLTERVSKTALNEHLSTTGELPKGARLEPAHERFYVK